MSKLSVRLKRLASQNYLVLRDDGIGTIKRNKSGTWTATYILGNKHHTCNTRGEAVAWLMGLTDLTPTRMLTAMICEKATHD